MRRLNNQPTENIVLALQERKAKNLQFFKEQFPPIYHLLSTMQFKRCKLNILTKDDELDLFVDGIAQYDGKANRQGLKEAKEFVSSYPVGKRINSVPSYDQTSFNSPRFFMQKAHNVVQFSAFENSFAKGYALPDFYPLVCFMGIGLAIHIEALVALKKIKHVVIAENNIEKLLASTHCVDWEKICEQFDPSKGQSISFVLTDEKEFPLYNALWNKLLSLSPMFPVHTLFYNHTADENYQKIVEKINGNLMQVPDSWGNYDDEINQVNNCLHNFELGIIGMPFYSEIPCEDIIVVGAGPSLNDNINFLAELQEKVTIISCGTALRALYTHGIKPDIHVEIESNADTKTVIEYINDNEWLRSIKLVAFAQVNPWVFQLFDKKVYFFKNQSCSAAIFDGLAPKLEYATPTAVNAGITIASYYRPKRIFLVGVDFGFKDDSKPHADGTMYELESIEQVFKNDDDYSKKDKWYTASVDGGNVRTNINMYRGKHCAEMLISDARQQVGIEFYNCSTGAKIEGTQWIGSSDEFRRKISNKIDEPRIRVENIIFDKVDFNVTNLYSERAQNKPWAFALNECSTNLKTIAKMLLAELPCTAETVDDISLLCTKINYLLNYFNSLQSYGSLQLLQGSMRHFLYALYTFSHLVEASIDIESYYCVWRENVYKFLEGIDQHFAAITQKKFDIREDDWLSKLLSDPE